MTQVHHLTINSVDRDWTVNNDTSFNFRIRFSPASSEMTKYPIYDNSPTIPATSTQASNGERGDSNTNGWYDTYGVFHLPYDPNRQPGNVVQYENIIFNSSQYAPINTDYKNITKIKLVQTIFPNLSKKILYTNITEKLSDYQYVNVVSDELNNSQEGTNSQLRKSFAILYPSTSDNQVFINFQNVNDSAIEYNPPLSSLNFLTVRCLDPLGHPINNHNDVLNISFIYYKIDDLLDNASEYLYIKTQDYFSPTEYKTGQRLQIKKYIYKSALLSNYDTNESQMFINFINREEGHYIIDTESSDDKPLHNTIKIAKPAILNSQSGDLEEYMWYSIFKIQGFTDDPNTINTMDEGKLINLNLQTTFFIDVTTENKIADFSDNKIERLTNTLNNKKIETIIKTRH